jgi:hypothetical protein
VRVEQSPAEVADRITILRLKAERALGADLTHVQAELAALLQAWNDAELPGLDALDHVARLAAVNARLWEVEDALRRHESRGTFDADFVALARSVYRLNDERAGLKRALNARLGSRWTEVKIHSRG